MDLENIKVNNEDLEKFLKLFKEYNPVKIIDNAKIINTNNINDIMFFIGCYKKIDNNQIIKGYNLCLPKINNLKSLLINIHEISHAIITNLNIDKKDCDDPFEECIPIAMERLYMTKYKNKYLQEFNKYQLNRLLEMKKDINKFHKYIIAFNYQFELYELYKNNPNLIFKHQFLNNYDLDELYENNIKILTKKLK